MTLRKLVLVGLYLLCSSAAAQQQVFTVTYGTPVGICENAEVVRAEWEVEWHRNSVQGVTIPVTRFKPEMQQLTSTEEVTLYNDDGTTETKIIEHWTAIGSGSWDTAATQVVAGDMADPGSPVYIRMVMWMSQADPMAASGWSRPSHYMKKSPKYKLEFPSTGGTAATVTRVD